jgi:tetratricopeptide (TPR) repeat protein
MAWHRLAFSFALAGSVVVSGVASGVVSVVASGVASADTVRLKDGTQLEGSVRRAADGGWVVTAGGNSTAVAADQVDSIDLSPAAPASAMVRLGSLRRATDNSDDPRDAVIQYQRFIEHSRDPAATAEAKKDLDVWHDRVARGATRVAGKWVRPDEKAKLIEQASVSTDLARQYLKQNRTLEAAPLLAGALAVDPQNVTAQYLTGLLAYDQDKLPAARKAFEAVAAAFPNHGPTLTNLAVVQWRQKQYAAAMANFDLAMQAAPVDRPVLDDVATALQQWPAGLVKPPVVTRAEIRFHDQDAKLADRLAPMGLHRVGATWVDIRDGQQVVARQLQAEAQLDSLAGEFDRAVNRIKQIDQSAAATADQMHRIEAQTLIVDPQTGVQVQLPLPPVYGNLARDLQRMSRDRGAEVGRLDVIKRQAQVIQSGRLELQGVGALRLIGPEGTPFKPPVPQAAPPATRPAG